MAADGNRLNAGDIAIVDPAQWHHYQPGWSESLLHGLNVILTHNVVARTLVGSGLKDKHDLRQPLADLIPSHIAHHAESVATFSPESNSVTTANGKSIEYDALIVAAGLKINWDGITNLPKALADPKSGVSSIYSFDTVDKAWAEIEVRAIVSLFFWKRAQARPFDR